MRYVERIEEPGEGEDEQDGDYDYLLTNLDAKLEAGAIDQTEYELRLARLRET